EADLRPREEGHEEDDAGRPGPRDEGAGTDGDVGDVAKDLVTPFERDRDVGDRARVEAEVRAEPGEAPDERVADPPDEPPGRVLDRRLSQRLLLVRHANFAGTSAK